MKNKQWKISFCIVCMNRLHQLRETLLRNINENKRYPDLEFILLDYNSSDGMEEWAKDHLGDLIAGGRLVYYRTREPRSFSHSHSKNIAFKLATGDIVCNINADHFAGEGYAEYINEKFNNDPNIVLTPIGLYDKQTKYSPPKDVMGKVCVKKSDFMLVKGFDERMAKYGFEDHDFTNRLVLQGVKRVHITDAVFLNFIAHPEDERYIIDTSIVESLHVCYFTPSVSELIILYKNGFFEKGTMINYLTVNASDCLNFNKPMGSPFPFYIKTNGLNGWLKGVWRQEGLHIQLFAEKEGDVLFSFNLEDAEEPAWMDEDERKRYFRIVDPVVVDSILRFNVYYYNRILMEDNLARHKLVVNENEFGKATVFKNFDNGSAIFI